MKNRILTLLLAFATALIFSSAVNINQDIKEENNNIYGLWWNQEKTAKIKIYKAVSGKTCGMITWLKEPNGEDGKPKKDTNNPDKEKAKKPILNLVILKHFVYKGKNEWEDGKIYDPKNGKTYSCEMTLSSNNKKLDIRGYVGFTFIGRTSTWTKVD